MKIETLINILQDYSDAHGSETEVRLMTQQNWPFENNIYGITSSDDIADLTCDPHSACPNCGEEYDDVVDNCEKCGTACEVTYSEEPETNYIYIVEGGQIRYGNKDAWECVRTS